MRFSLGIPVAFALAGSLAAIAAEVGDPRAGYAVASAICAQCHAVGAADAISPNSDAPAFSSVAKRSEMTGRALAVWLQTSHPTMPNIILGQGERNNVIAYIMSLKPIPPP